MLAAAYCNNPEQACLAITATSAAQEGRGGPSLLVWQRLSRDKCAGTLSLTCGK